MLPIIAGTPPVTIFAIPISNDTSDMNQVWPDIPYLEWRGTCDALHRYLQIAGKYRLAHTPWVNHSWHATLYVSTRGLTTFLIPDSMGGVEVLFDFVDHEVRAEASSGKRESFDLEPMSVAGFHARFVALIDRVGGNPEFHGKPNEIPDPVSFKDDIQKRPYDRSAVERFHGALLASNQVFQEFRTSFLGKVSPVHVFWGSFDLAVTRFSGRPAPEHPGGIPELPDEITREAYSHEVSSAGFWAGGGPIDEPAFYSYAYPMPKDFDAAPVKPASAYFDPSAGEFILPYAAVRLSKDPKQTLMSFLKSTYDAAATLGNWERDALDCGTGRLRQPRIVD